jgi:hypothetical protein
MRATAKRRSTRRLAQSALAVCILAGVNGISPVSASELITLSSEEYFYAEPGSLTNLAQVSINPSFIGQQCHLSVLSQNQSSIHEGNDLIVTTGDVETVIADVEAEAHGALDLSSDIILGPTLSVDLRMGPDWLSSVGFSLSLDCGTTEPVQLAEPTVEPAPAEVPSAPPAEVPITPPAELPTPPPAGEVPDCPDPSNGSLSVLPTTCPDGEPESAPVSPEPSVEPATTEQASPPAEPAVEPTSPDPAPETAAEPEVLGLQLERLPEAGPALAIPKAPNYNG